MFVVLLFGRTLIDIIHSSPLTLKHSRARTHTHKREQIVFMEAYLEQMEFDNLMIISGL